MPFEPRHGFRLQCQQCSIRNNVGGYENPKQFAKILREHTKKHKSHDGFELIQQSYHAAELQHVFQESTTDFTHNTTTFTDVTNAAISSASFTAGKKYYIEVTGVLNSPTNNIGFRVQTLHGTTAWAESHFDREKSGSSDRYVYNWWTVWTAVSGEGIKLQVANDSGTGTTNIDNITMVAIKLSDDLVENTDWFVHEPTPTTTSLTTTDSSTNNASITISSSPPADSKWLVKTKNRVTGTSGTSNTGSRIVRSGAASSTTPFCHYEGEDTSLDSNVFTNTRVFTLGASSSNTFTEKGFSVASNNGTRQSSGVFALNLSKLKNSESYYSDTETGVLAEHPSWTEVGTVSITPDVTGDVWVHGFATMLVNNAVITEAAGFRLQVNNTDQPDTQTSDRYIMIGWDSRDEIPWTIQSIENLTASTTYPVDVDGCIVIQTGSRSKTARCVSVFAATMELAAAGGQDLVEIKNEPVSISENVVVNLKRAEAVNETEAIQEAVNMRMARTEIKNEAISIPENVVVRVDMAPRLVNETENITENVVLRLARSTVVSETISVNEDVVVKLNRITPPIDETVTISEQIVVKMTMAPRIIDETEAITENVVYHMNLAHTISENESILENVVAVVALPAKTIEEIEQITENVVVKLNLAHVIANETLSIAENVVVLVKSTFPPIDETVSIGEDVVIKLNRVNPPVNETVTIAENVVVRIQNVRQPINETIGITEDVVAKLGLSRVADETVSVSENVVVSIGRINPPIDETVAIGEDIVVKVNRIEPPINEQVSIPEQIVVHMQNVRQPVNEAVDITESVIAKLGITRPSIDETVSILEDVIAKLGISRPPINETVTIPENIVVKLQLAPQVVNETVSINEATILRMDRIQPSIDEQIGIEEDVVVKLDRVELVGEQLSISENIIVKLTTQETQEINEAVSISENVTIKVTEQEVFPAPLPGGGGAGFRPKTPTFRQKRRIWPKMSLKTYDPVKYVKQDTRYKPKTLEKQLLAPRQKVRRAFTAIYDIQPLSQTQQQMLEQAQELDKLSQSLNDTLGITNNPKVQAELEQLLKQRQIQRKPAKVAKSFVAKYDILSKINKPFTMEYEKATLISKTFIANYDIKVFDWAKLRTLQTARTMLVAMAAMEELETIDNLDE